MKNLRPAVTAEIDQDWAEAREWFSSCNWTPEGLDRFGDLLSCDTEKLRKTASADELNCIQRLAFVAFSEVWKRTLDKRTLDSITEESED